MKVINSTEWLVITLYHRCQPHRGKGTLTYSVWWVATMWFCHLIF